jgi:hypothetical protein
VADIGRGIDTDERHERVLALLAGIETVKALVHRRLFDRWPLAAISAEVGTSVFALCRLFRRHAGLPLHRYRPRASGPWSGRGAVPLAKRLDPGERGLDFPRRAGLCSPAISTEPRTVATTNKESHGSKEEGEEDDP